MACINPQKILSPESRWLKKCRSENRPFEYYIKHANDRRNLQFDPVPLVESPYEYYYDSKRDYRYMSVPCGKCDLCLKSRVDKYFIRCYYEFLRCTRARHGSVWFITLTYGDEMLPKVEYRGKIYLCFNKRHIQTWLKRLRKYSSLRFSYFLVSEFGGEFGRPHYHALLFIEDFESNDRNLFKLQDFVAQSWTKIEDRRHSYNSMSHLGLFDLQRVDVRKVDSSALIRYTSKYVGKQIGAQFFDELRIDPIYKRFHLQSLGLGDCLYDYCNNDLWHKGYIELDGYKYAIPDYYKIKIMRDYYCTFDDGTIVYQPTDFKFAYFEEMSRKQIEECKNLSRLNSDFPVPPSWTYDPVKLEAFSCFVDEYILTRQPPAFDDCLVPVLWSDWQDYLLEVQKYNESRFRAKAEQWRKQQEDHYLKKTGRKV